MRIVPIALKNYFVDNIPVEQTIKNHTDIYDFCMRLKTNSKSDAYWRCISGSKIKDIPLHRTTRYYISNSGGSLIKKFTSDKSESGVNVGYVTTIFNKFENKNIEDYNINYNFYINEAMKIKNSIDNGQLSLF